MGKDSLNAKLRKKSDETEKAAVKSEALARAEAKLSETMKKEPAVRKVVRAAARLADFITDEDREESMRVIREAKTAETRIYDNIAKTLVPIPDHKTRLAAVTLERAYDEGTPIKRQITLTGTFESADQVMERLRESPEALKAIMSSGLRLEIGGDVIEGGFSVQKGVQDSGNVPPSSEE